MKTNKSTPSPIKGMPNAPEAEQAVIGSLLSFGGDKVFDAISPELNKDMFYDNRYAVLYNAIQSLYANNKPCDIVSVSNEIRSMGKIDEVPPCQPEFISLRSCNPVVIPVCCPLLYIPIFLSMFFNADCAMSLNDWDSLCPIKSCCICSKAFPALKRTSPISSVSS